MTDDDIDEVLKEKWVEVFNQCDGKLMSKQITDLTKSFETGQNITHILKCRGKLYFIMGRYEEALADFTKLLEFETNNAFALRYRGETYYIMKRYEESFIDLNELLKINPNNLWTLKAYEEVIRKYVYNS